MPEHIHLLISEPAKRNPSTVMQALKLGFARRVLAQIRRRPAQATLFDLSLHHTGQKRFYDFDVWSLKKQMGKLNYMHDNPVKRGLVESPALWRWSSYRTYFLGETGKVRINQWDVLKLKARAPAA
jgi:putative transposase